MKRLGLMGGLVLLATIPLSAGGNNEEIAVAAEPGYESVTVANAINVQWRVEGDSLHVQLTAPTTGWISVGFEPSAMMRDADIKIGYVQNGQAFVEDHYGTGRTQHAPDVEHGGTSDLSNIEGSESDGVTVLRFTMPLDSGDSLDKVLVPGETYRIIAAHGPNGRKDFGSYHATRGSAEITL